MGYLIDFTVVLVHRLCSLGYINIFSLSCNGYQVWPHLNMKIQVYQNSNMCIKKILIELLKYVNI